MLSNKCNNKFINETTDSIPKTSLFCGGTKVIMKGSDLEFIQTMVSRNNKTLRPSYCFSSDTPQRHIQKLFNLKQMP